MAQGLLAFAVAALMALVAVSGSQGRAEGGFTPDAPHAQPSDFKRQTIE